MKSLKYNKLAFAIATTLLSSSISAVEIEVINVTATKQVKSIQEVPYNLSLIHI